MTDRHPLTTKQHAILTYLVTFWGVNQRFPTVREVCTEFGFQSPNAAKGHVRAMAAKGWVRVTDRTARGVEVVGLDPVPAAADYLSRLPKPLEDES